MAAMNRGIIVLAAVGAILGAWASAAEIKTLEPAKGAAVALLTDEQRAYFDMPYEQRREKFVDEAFRRNLGYPAALGSDKEKSRAPYLPKAVHLAWEPLVGVNEYRVSVRDTRTGATVAELSVKGDAADIDNLEVAAEYEWIVSGGGATGGGRFRTEDRTPRLVRFPGMANVRDIGGWVGLDGRRVKQGLVFRSAGMNANAGPLFYTVEELRALGKDKELKEASYEAKKRLDQLLAWQADPDAMDLKDVDYIDWSGRHSGEPLANFLASRIRHAKRAYEAGGSPKVVKGVVPGKSWVEGANGEYIRSRFGIRTDLDLRSDEECHGMTGSPLGPDVKWFHYPSSAYGGMQDKAGKEAFAKAFRVFLDERNYPIDFHCISGADRTGSVSYILCGLLGADDDRLARDWEASGFWTRGTGFCHAKRYDRLVDGFKKNFPAATMRERLEKYVLSLGFSEEDIATFRRIMLE